MTAPAYNPAFPPPAPAGRLSKSALTSFILGLLGCIPFVTGILAVILGIVGFVKTGKPGVKGRWMAIVGTILGAISIFAWALFGATMTAAIFAAIGFTEAPRIAAHDFIRDLAAGNEAEVRAHSTGFTDDDIKEFHDIFSAKGTFQDTTFSSSNRVNDEAVLEGTASFSGGSKHIKVSLTKQGDIWKVDGLSVQEPK